MIKLMILAPLLLPIEDRSIYRDGLTYEQYFRRFDDEVQLQRQKQKAWEAEQRMDELERRNQELERRIRDYSKGDIHFEKDD